MRGFTNDLPLWLPATEIETQFDDLHGEGMKVLIPSKNIDIWTKLKVLLALNLSGHTDTLTEANYLIYELENRVEIQIEQQ